MILNGNTRYGLPPQGQAVKLEPGEWARVRLAGFYKGHIRCGKRAFACVFLPRLDEPGWIYVSKGNFLNVVVWVDQHVKSFEGEFCVEYQGGQLIDCFTVEEMARKLAPAWASVQRRFGKAAEA